MRVIGLLLALLACVSVAGCSCGSSTAVMSADAGGADEAPADDAGDAIDAPADDAGDAIDAPADDDAGASDSGEPDAPPDASVGPVIDIDNGTMVTGTFDLESVQDGTGQTFTAVASSMDFVDLALDDDLADATGSDVLVVIREGSITGPVLATSMPAIVEDAGIHEVRIMFAAPVPLTPGATYAFQVRFPDACWPTCTVFAIDDVSVATGTGYAGGEGFRGGAPGGDLWFRVGRL